MRYIDKFNKYNEGILDYFKKKRESREIKDICNRYVIHNYTINKDGSVDVNGDVYLNGKRIEEIPVKFGNVTGGFNVSRNRLKSLKGSPEHVGGSFTCESCAINSFEYAPKSVYNLYCMNNYIWNFDHCPSIGGHLYCMNNPIHGIWNLFNDASKIPMFQEYDIIRENKLLVVDRLNAFLEDIGKPKVKAVRGYNNYRFNK